METTLLKKRNVIYFSTFAIRNDPIENKKINSIKRGCPCRNKFLTKSRIQEKQSVGGRDNLFSEK